MKISWDKIAWVLLFAIPLRSLAATLYVDQQSPSPTPPYTSWNTAATNIQDAIDAATVGDLVLVTNGVYATGGKVMAGDLTNRVAIDKAITVQSVNGWAVTTIEGRRDFVNSGATAVRCVWMTYGAVLSGFTVRGGQTRSSGDAETLRNGGGVWCSSTNAIISSSVIRDNAAALFGGGCYRGMLLNSLISGSQASSGGGAAAAVIVNSAIVANSASSFGGGAYQSTLTNCTVSGNTAVQSGGGTHSTSIYNSVIWGNSSPAPIIVIVASTPPAYSCLQASSGGTGNIYVNPQLAPDGIHLSAASPCRSAGSSLYAAGTDFDGETWGTPPSMGCDEWREAPVAGQPEVSAFYPGGIQFRISSTGQEPLSYWWLKDGVIVSDGARHAGATTPNLQVASVAPDDAGSYQTIVSNTFGVTTSLVARVVARWVDAGSVSPAAPYATWATAAASIQDAVDASDSGDFVFVTNGIYANGGKVMSGDLTNRIALDKAVTVLSVNGPAVTFIEGQKDPSTTNGPAAIRVAWISQGAQLDGFTLRNGSTRSAGNQVHLLSGGGVWASGTNALVSHCILVSNAAHYGGGAYRGWLSQSTIAANFAQVDGGGAYSNLMTSCWIRENQAIVNGGGAASARVWNSAVTMNFSQTGGGLYGGTVGNSTVTLNKASIGGGIYSSGGVTLLTNSIVWGNSASLSSPNYNGGVFYNSCSTPLPSGAGNISSDPLLLSDSIHVATNSPCRMSGLSVATGVDVDGHPWSNPPSMGCDEWNPQPVLTPAKVYPETWGRVRISATAIGLPPFTYHWLKDGELLANGGYLTGTDSANLSINPSNPTDAGSYQLIASNSLGVVTSLVAQLTLRFVDVNCVAAAPPYTNWITAATNIQDAVDAAMVGDLILVASGIYGRGGKAMAGDLTNRVALDKPITMMSVDGPLATVIQGTWDYATTNGPGAVRGVWLGEGTTLAGFTVRGGGTRGPIGSAATLQAGGGVWCNSTNALVTGCIIEGNAAGSGGGGGIYSGTCRSSVIRRNSSVGYGAGALFSTLANCTVTENQGSSTANTGSGVASNRVYNSIIWGNTRVGSFTLQEHIGAQLTNSCTRPLPAGTGNISAEPMLDSDGIHLLAGSPCVSAGSVAWTAGLDFDGQSWSNPPAMGCDQRWPQLAVTAPLLVANGDAKIRLRVEAVGSAPSTYQWFKDGVMLGNDAHLTGAQSAELAISAFGPADFGGYHTVVSNALGAVSTAITEVRARFVDPAAVAPAPPFTNWTTAATSIQAAIDAAEYGDLIVVADGVHASGGRVVAGDLTNRVVLTKAVLVSSLNGPDGAIIEGEKDLVGPNGNGNSAVRPVWMESWTSLAGFTIRQGATRTNGDVATLQSGGGVWGVSAAAVVRGSLVTNNAAHRNGGGVLGAGVENSLLTKNVASSGGGIFGGRVEASRLIENQALNSVGHGGGGANFSVIRNSVIHKNTTVNPTLGGGGTYDCAVYNSTVTENVGSGLNWGFAYNTIAWGNTPRDYYGSLSMHFSCASFAVTSYGTNNLYVDPQLVDSYHLSENSLVRSAGGPLFVSGADIDGDPWGNPVSIGADEFVMQSITGALSVSIELPVGPINPNRTVWLFGRINGRAARVEWTFETGGPQTNLSYATTRSWPAPGIYPITFRAFNESHPTGVATAANVEVVAVPAPNWASIENLGYQRFYINTTVGVTNHIEFTTNLAPPVVWLPLKTSVATNALMREFDFESTNAARFYRIRSE